MTEHFITAPFYVSFTSALIAKFALRQISNAEQQINAEQNPNQ